VKKDELMATRQAIIDTVEEGKAIVKQTYSGLSEQQAQIRVGSASDGWSAKEVLAHMASRKPTYERLIQMANGTADSLGANVDMDERNEKLLAPLRNLPIPELMNQYNTLSDWVIDQARTLPDETLATVITLPQRAIPLGDLLMGAAGTHTINHTKEVQEALAKAK
jgi:hypothetical protein